MFLILSPTLRLILGGTQLRSLDVTVLYKRSSANLNSFVESNCFIFNETAFPVVFFALLLLLGHVVGDVGGVAPLVVRVVTLHHIIILGLFDHLHLVNTSLAISVRSSGRYFVERWGFGIPAATSIGWISVTLSRVSVPVPLPGINGIKILKLLWLSMVFMMITMTPVMILIIGCIKWKGINQ